MCLGNLSNDFGSDELPERFEQFRAVCLRRAEADLVPATPDEIDRAIVMLSGLPVWDADGVKAAAIDAVFHIGLDDVPADLLRFAVIRAIKTMKRRPTPGHLREFIADEFDCRQRRLARLQIPRSAP